MLKNYLKTAFRNLLKNRSYTIINVLGLSLGITCSLFLFLLISYWLSFDTFQTNYNRIYRIVTESDGQLGRRAYQPGTPVPLIDAFRTDFPEVEKAAFVTFPHYALIGVDHETDGTRFFEEGDIAYMEPAFYQIFDRTWLAGNPASALDEPGEIVLSETQAKKFFGETTTDQFLGKTLMLDKETPLKVSGIVADHPVNTDFPFDIIVSYATIKDRMSDHWGSISSNDQVYVQLSEGQSPASINERFPQFVEKYYGNNNDNHKAHFLQPLSDLHFNESYSTYSYNTVSKTVIWTMGILALFLVLTACVNFINLATAISVKRSREVGIRKVLGGTRWQLIKQFLGETTIITLLAVFIALGLTELLLLKANPFLELSLDLNLLTHHQLQVYLICITIMISLLSGLYPAFVQSRFKPVLAMKNLITSKSTGGFSIRRSLVVFQFFISQIFIIGTIALFSQMQYIRQTDLGFDKDAIVTVSLPEGDASMKKTLRTELQQLPGVEMVSLAYHNPSSTSVSTSGFQLEGSEDNYRTQVKIGDQNYIDIYGLQLVAGEGLLDSDTFNRLVVNETFVKDMGIASPEEALGRMIKFWDNDVPIVGVVKDFHTTSLRNQIEATVIANNIADYGMVAIKIQPGKIEDAVKGIEKTWKAFYPEYAFDYGFVDVEIEQFYRGERKMTGIISIAAIIAILIGCLGLYGLITFMAEQRTKEIGIRKVLGASVVSIARLFSFEFMKLVVIAFVLAVPLTWFLLQKWLENYTYKIDLGFGLFGAALLATLAIAFVTVGYRTFKAAVANPVEALRNE